MPRIFFATDLHGSEMCWRKFLNAAKFYDADVLICGGDMTGKAIVPIVQENGHYTFTLAGVQQAVGAEQVGEVEAQIRRKGYYPLQMSVERLNELDKDEKMRAETFQQVMLEGVDRWMGMAAEKLRGTGVRCFVCPGNDDEMEVDDVVRRSDQNFNVGARPAQLLDRALRLGAAIGFLVVAISRVRRELDPFALENVNRPVWRIDPSHNGGLALIG